MKLLKHEKRTSLLDVINKITQIRIVDDETISYTSLQDAYDYLVADDEIDIDYKDINDDYDQQEIDEFYLGVHDELLSKLSNDVIHKFENLDLILRIAKLDKKKLSAKQQELLLSVLSVKNKEHDEVTDKDIHDFIKLLKSCNVIIYDDKHRKTNKFIRNNNKEFRLSAVLDVLHSLRFEDWVYTTRSIKWDYVGDKLFIFKPKVNWIDKDGIEHKELTLYIKLDVDISSKSAIALVSFHNG